MRNSESLLSSTKPSSTSSLATSSERVETRPGTIRRAIRLLDLGTNRFRQNSCLRCAARTDSKFTGVDKASRSDSASDERPRWSSEGHARPAFEGNESQGKLFGNVSSKTNRFRSAPSLDSTASHMNNTSSLRIWTRSKPFFDSRTISNIARQVTRRIIQTRHPHRHTRKAHRTSCPNTEFHSTTPPLSRDR